MGTREIVDQGLQKLGRGATVRARVVAAGSVAAAVAAGVAGAVVARRRRDHLEFPDAAELGAAAGASIHDAVKGNVITAVRSAEAPDEALVVSVVRDGFEEAAGAGADVLAVAVGAVEGAAEIAHLLGGSRRHLAGLAARTAIEAAARQGPVAAERVERQVAAYLAP